MKTISKIIIGILLVFNLGLWVNYAINKPPTEWVLKCKVISKGSQDKVNNYKHYSTIEGTRRTFIVYNNQFGYGEIPTTLNTYITTKEGETVTFDLDWRNIRDFFGKDVSPNLIYNEGLFLVLFMLSVVILGLIIINKEINKEEDVKWKI